jgi:hypothetical protein
MNKLGTSTNDMKRYDELKRKEKIFQSYTFQKAVELDPKM